MAANRGKPAIISHQAPALLYGRYAVQISWIAKKRGDRCHPAKSDSLCRLRNVLFDVFLRTTRDVGVSRHPHAITREAQQALRFVLNQRRAQRGAIMRAVKTRNKALRNHIQRNGFMPCIERLHQRLPATRGRDELRHACNDARMRRLGSANRDRIAARAQCAMQEHHAQGLQRHTGDFGRIVRSELLLSGSDQFVDRHG
ncbi:MAG: hypothetical protein QM803_15665 [Rhodocyclaceae bacterium]